MPPPYSWSSVHSSWFSRRSSRNPDLRCSPITPTASPDTDYLSAEPDSFPTPDEYLEIHRPPSRAIISSYHFWTFQFPPFPFVLGIRHVAIWEFVGNGLNEARAILCNRSTLCQCWSRLWTLQQWTFAFEDIDILQRHRDLMEASRSHDAELADTPELQALHSPVYSLASWMVPSS